MKGGSQNTWLAPFCFPGSWLMAVKATALALDPLGGSEAGHAASRGRPSSVSVLFWAMGTAKVLAVDHWVCVSSLRGKTRPGICLARDTTFQDSQGDGRCVIRWIAYRSARFFVGKLPGRSSPIGRPSGSKALGPGGIDIELVRRARQFRCRSRTPKP